MAGNHGFDGDYGDGGADVGDAAAVDGYGGDNSDAIA